MLADFSVVGLVSVIYHILMHLSQSPFLIPSAIFSSQIGQATRMYLVPRQLGHN
jgi:hypothetical protein